MREVGGSEATVTRTKRMVRRMARGSKEHRTSPHRGRSEPAGRSDHKSLESGESREQRAGDAVRRLSILRVHRTGRSRNCATAYAQMGRAVCPSLRYSV